MSYLECVDAEYCYGRVDTEALQTGQHSVGSNEEGDHVSECGDGDGDPSVLHSLAKPGIQIFIILLTLFNFAFMGKLL